MHAHQLLGPPAPAGCQANCALRTLALHAAHCLPTNNNNNKYDACGKCVTRRKQQRPGIASNDNTTHVPTARSSADLTKPNQTPTQLVYCSHGGVTVWSYQTAHAMMPSPRLICSYSAIQARTKKQSSAAKKFQRTHEDCVKVCIPVAYRSLCCADFVLAKGLAWPEAFIQTGSRLDSLAARLSQRDHFAHSTTYHAGNGKGNLTVPVIRYVQVGS